MKISIKTMFHLSIVVAVLSSLRSGELSAQTFTTLHSFVAFQDGWRPYAGLILSSTNLYGTTAEGGNSGGGTVFRLNADGAGFTKLHEFNGTNDGAALHVGLILSGETLYGATASGVGSGGLSSVFALNTDGTSFRTLYSFSALIGYPDKFGGISRTNGDGVSPFGPLLLSGDTLYGTATAGGSAGNGTLFKINIDGTGFVTLHNFTTSSGPINEVGPTDTNTDGIYPSGTLVLIGDMLYGTAAHGGRLGYGTVFAVPTNGTYFKTLHNFSAIDGDGINPDAGLIVLGNTLYGTTRGGGGSGSGTVFKLNTDGTGFRVLHSFTALPSSTPFTNSDGAIPDANLAISGNKLYGTAFRGGSLGYGTVFELNTDSAGFKVLHSFTGGSDGFSPLGELIVSGNILYGTTEFGGSSGNGTVFSVSLPVTALTIIPSRENFILTWPTNAAELTLQSTTNLASAAIWTTNSSAPVVVNGLNTLTNPISGTQQFFRLSQ